jgi:hypothetical protein
MYQKITPDYKFKIKDKIRLSGREGKIIDYCSDGNHWEVTWNNGWSHELFLKEFPDLEVWIDDPKISRAAAEKIKKIRMDCEKLTTPYSSFDCLIDSMVDENL